MSKYHPTISTPLGAVTTFAAIEKLVLYYCQDLGVHTDDKGVYVFVDTTKTPYSWSAELVGHRPSCRSGEISISWSLFYQDAHRGKGEFASSGAIEVEVKERTYFSFQILTGWQMLGNFLRLRKNSPRTSPSAPASAQRV